VGGKLAFSRAIPPDLRRPGPLPLLRLVIESSGDASEAFEYELAEGSWTREVVSLDSFEGDRVDLRFELSSPGVGEAVCALAEPILIAPASTARTVLFVTSDTHRADHLGAARSAVRVETSVLDRLARGGVLFERCFSTANSTVPSHVTLMTGVHPRDSGITDNRLCLSEQAETLAERFHEAGFATWALVSSRLLMHSSSGIGQGFDRLSAPVEADRPAGETVPRLFVWLHLYDSHGPYEPPEPFAGRYYPGGRDPYDPSLADPAVPPGELPSHLAGLRDLEWPRTQYRAEVDYLDSQLGRVMDHPRFRGAIIAVTADHGECLGQHGIYFRHAGLFPDTVHVPLILRFPGSPAGARVERLVSHADLARTLLDLAGLWTAVLDGRNLMRFVEGSRQPEEPAFALAAHGYSASITSGGWHLIFHLRIHLLGKSVPPRTRHQVELYDLFTDPGCLTDLTEREPARARGLRAALVDWLNGAADRGWVVGGHLSESVRRDLAALGYVADEDEDPGRGTCVPRDCPCENCRPYR